MAKKKLKNLPPVLGEPKFFEEGQFDDGTKYDLFFGKKPHATSDNNFFARVRGTGEVYPFDGHRIRTRVEMREMNYLKSSDLSGDEIRKGGEAKIFMNDRQVYAFFFRDIRHALLKAHRLIEELLEHSSRIWEPEKLEGRKVYYHNVPATITRFIPEQGAVVIQAVDGAQFPQPAYALEDGEDGCEDRTHVKDDILSPHIWWFRDKAWKTKRIDS